MKIAFFTESNSVGKYPRDFSNTRTEVAWMIALDATHFNIHTLPEEKFDLGIVVIPKKCPHFDIDRIKQCCDKIAVMQEGPNWFWQDYDVATQIWYYNILCSVDYIFAHNHADVLYYKGLTNHPKIGVLPSLIIEDTVAHLTEVEREGAIIGGNFTSWYGGFDSMLIAQLLDPTRVVTAPSMGRKQPNEEHLVHHLPYMTWTQWILKLNEFKYGVHLMRTHAAGTFALNCAYLGIPCIGYKGLDTQQNLHPNLTVESVAEAREIAKYLGSHEDYYLEQSQLCKQKYNKLYTEVAFKENFAKLL